jgi:spore coat polysaccharide biosynthesis protein SpsF (cytidylyltransferase family)
VDAPEDLEFVRIIYARFKGNAEFSGRDVLDLLEREPELQAINQNVQQKALY